MVAKAFATRGSRWVVLASCWLAPKTMLTILKVAEVATVLPAAWMWWVPGRFVHACTLVTRTPSSAHQPWYASTRVYSCCWLQATRATSSAKLTDGTRHQQ